MVVKLGTHDCAQRTQEMLKFGTDITRIIRMLFEVTLHGAPRDGGRTQHRAKRYASWRVLLCVEH